MWRNEGEQLKLCILKIYNFPYLKKTKKKENTQQQLKQLNKNYTVVSNLQVIINMLVISIIKRKPENTKKYQSIFFVIKTKIII